MHPRRLVIALLTAVLASTLTLVVACGSSSSGNQASGGDSGGSDSPSGNDGGFDTSLSDSSHADTSAQDDGSADASIDRLPFPNVISFGQPQMTAPKVVTMTF